MFYSNEKDLNKIKRTQRVFKTFQQQFLVKILASKQVFLGIIYSLLKTYTREIWEKMLDRAYSLLVKYLGSMTEKSEFSYFHCYRNIWLIIKAKIW